MSKIEASEWFRMTHTDSTFKIEFDQVIDKNAAFIAIKNAVESINFENGYRDLWLQDLEECALENGFDIESTLWCDEFSRYIPAMCKAVAEVFPSVTFHGNACHDSVKCYCIYEFEYSYDGKDLHIKETIYDDEVGYFCPECGFRVAFADEILEEDEIVCEDCEETVKVADLEFVPPYVTEETITINH